MSFIKGLKRAFGFSTDGDELDNDVEYYDGSARSGMDKQKSQWVPKSKPDDSVAESDPDAGTDTSAIPTSVLDYLVEVINGNLSPVIVGSLDLDAEKKALEQKLAPKMDSLLENIKNEAHTAAEVKSQAKISEIDAELKKVQEQNQELLKTVENQKAKLQTEEAQRKAQATKLAEVEARNAQIESELEQYSLENKGLVNKTKVLSVLEQQKEELNQEVQRVQALLNQIRAKNVEQENKIAQLEKQIAENESEDSELSKQFQEEMNKVEEFKQKKNTEIATLKSQIQELKQLEGAENEEARTKLIQAQERENLLAKEISDLKKNISETAAVRNQRDLDMNSHIADLKNQLAIATKQNEDHIAQVNSLNKAHQQQTDKVKELTERCGKLDEELRVATSELAKTQNELDKTRAALNQRASEQKQNTEKLQQMENQLASAKEQLNRQSATTPAPSEPHESAIALDDIDWLMPETPAPAAPEVKPEPEPEPTGRNDDGERQYSLF